MFNHKLNFFGFISSIMINERFLTDMRGNKITFSLTTKAHLKTYILKMYLLITIINFLLTIFKT